MAGFGKTLAKLKKNHPGGFFGVCWVFSFIGLY
jgi:hypothetical protein